MSSDVWSRLFCLEQIVLRNLYGMCQGWVQRVHWTFQMAGAGFSCFHEKFECREMMLSVERTRKWAVWRILNCSAHSIFDKGRS